MTKELQRAANVLEWEIDESEISICTREDGSDYLLGAGGFGRVSSLSSCVGARARACARACAGACALLEWEIDESKVSKDGSDPLPGAGGFGQLSPWSSCSALARACFHAHQPP